MKAVMNKIRLASLAKIIIPAFFVCAVLIFAGIIGISAAWRAEKEIFASIKDRYVEALGEQTAAELARIQAMSDIMFPAFMWPSNVPRVMSGSLSGSRARFIISWYFISGFLIWQLGVLPQWNPIKTSVNL